MRIAEREGHAANVVRMLVRRYPRSVGGACSLRWSTASGTARPMLPIMTTIVAS